MTENPTPAIDSNQRRLRTLIHDHLRILSELRVSLASVALSLARDEWRTGNENLEARVIHAAVELRAALTRFIAKMGDREESSDVSDILAPLCGALEFLALVDSHLSAVAMDQLRQTAHELVVCTRRALAERRPMPREGLKTLERQAERVERLACLHDLSRCMRLLETTGVDLRVGIGMIGGGEPAEISGTEFSLDQVVAEAVESQRHVAASRGIDLSLKLKAPSATVRLPRADLFRCVASLLDNAIKYSGSLPPGSIHRRPWVLVKTQATKVGVSLAIESWGVPLTAEEVSEGLPFKLGFRGYYARRMMPNQGTGVGLTDVKEFAERHGGDLTLDTDPLPKQADIPNTTTTVTLTLRRVLK
jgi:signal transduction histidine kinase